LVASSTIGIRDLTSRKARQSRRVSDIKLTMTQVKPPGAQILQFPTKVGVGASGPVAPNGGQKKTPVAIDQMEQPGKAMPIPAPQTGGQSSLATQLMARLPTSRVARSSNGKGTVLNGSVDASSKAGLKVLDGIDKVDGDLTLGEGVFRNIDLTLLSELREVAGRFTFEGNLTT
jgi:hypothetical protein